VTDYQITLCDDIKGIVIKYLFYVFFSLLSYSQLLNTYFILSSLIVQEMFRVVYTEFLLFTLKFC